MCSTMDRGHVIEGEYGLAYCTLSGGSIVTANHTLTAKLTKYLSIHRLLKITTYTSLVWEGTKDSAIYYPSRWFHVNYLHLF